MHGQARALFVGAVGVLISALVVYFLHRAELRRSRADFDRRARDIHVAIEANFRTPLETLRAMPPFFAASESVERAEFAAFVESALQRQPAIAYLGWAPEVADQDRAAFEQRARETGWAEFRIREPGPRGTPESAARRDRYIPLLHLEPKDEGLLGLDLLSDRRQSAGTDAALSSGTPSVAPGFLSDQRRPGDELVAVYAALAKAAQPSLDPRVPRRGLAVLALRVAPLVRASVSDGGLHGLDLVMLDESGPGAAHVLFESSLGAASLPVAEADAVWTEVMPYGGRRWEMRFLARPGTITAGPTPLAVGALGLLLTLASVIVLGSFEVIRRLRREVSSALQLGPYRLVRKLGEGGMGVVYQAEHALLKRPTAVKMISPRAGGAELIERFEREVQATSQLTHPNTVAVFDYGRTPEGVFYYAMEYLSGVTLDRLVRETGPLPPARVAYLLRQVCGSLQEAHERGLVHRDIKPGNIMICERGGIADFVKVLDFGLVKDTSTGKVTQLSRASHVLGTPEYMAPEALQQPTKTSPSIDIYAVGAVAYFALTGSEVFESSSLPELMAHHLRDEPKPPSARLGRPLPAELEALVLRCLSKAAEQRPASAAELGSLLSRCPMPVWSQSDARRFWQEYRAREQPSAGPESDDTALCSTVAVDRAKRPYRPPAARA